MTTILPNMIHRQLLQRMLSGEWKTLNQLDIAAGEGLLVRMTNHGWIERQGNGRDHKLKITPTGIEAMKAPIPNKIYPRLPRGASVMLR